MPYLGAPEGVTAELVRDAKRFREALLVNSEVFCSPPPSGGEFAEYAVELEKLRQHERREPLERETSISLRFVAFTEAASEDECKNTQKAVGAAGAQIVGETVRLWGAGTLVDFRGRGAYRALVVQRCRVAHALGANPRLNQGERHHLRSNPRARRLPSHRRGAPPRVEARLESSR